MNTVFGSLNVQNTNLNAFTFIIGRALKSIFADNYLYLLKVFYLVCNVIGSLEFLELH